MVQRFQCDLRSFVFVGFLGTCANLKYSVQTADKALATQLRAAFERDDARKIHDLENRLKCRLEGVQSLEGSLTIKLKPFSSSDAVAFEVVFRFVVSWVETCVRGNIMSLSRYIKVSTLADLKPCPSRTFSSVATD